MLLVASSALVAQTFRGSMDGTVTDTTGAMVAGAQIEAVDVATGIKHDTVSSSSGGFSFSDLPLGAYTVTATATGFATVKVDKVPVSAGAAYTLPIKLSVAQAAETVEVNAAALSLDTTSTTQTAGVGGKSLQDTPMNGRDFTQLIILSPGFSNAGAGGYGSLNGTRANQINWQIDGIDNNDLWHNIPAVNQGGVSGIAGVILPIDAVDQFSAQTQAGPESGRNPGGSVNLSLKAGGNDLHGSVYYYNRNEFFGATNPFTAPVKQEVRNYNYGFSAGGPFIKDKFFWFTTYEHQRFTIGVPDQATEPSTGYQTAALAALAKYGIAVNPVSQRLLATLWPAEATGNLATSQNNYTSTTPESGYSYDGLVKLDYTINEKNTLSAHWFVGQGNQIAPVGSALYYYYEVAPIHVQNYAIVYNHVFTPTLTNQVLAGVNYFNQVFNDFNNSFDTASLGLVTGSTLPGAPTISISGFDPVGETPPEGRNDITGHLTDDLAWNVGKHQMKFGGELRKAQLDEFYHRHALGSFTFDGSQGPVANPTLTGDTYGTGDLRVDALADFLAGRVQTSSIALGDPDRQVFVNTLAFFGQDEWQLSPRLNINYGLRWDYEGPLHNQYKNLSVFRPDQGGVVYQGAGIDNLYDPSYTNFSPRVGFSYQLSQRTVLRGGAGLFYDTPNLNPFLDNRPGNGAPNGVEGNPGGTDPVTTATSGGYTIQDGVNTFPDALASDSIFSIAKNFVPSHNFNFNLQLEQSLSSKVIAQVGYVGTEGRHLLSILDINQAAPGVYATTAEQNATRPYYAQFPSYTFINQIESIGTSNYNSLQATIRASGIHGFTAQASYTWSHSFDEVTAYRGALPQDSTNFRGDYGPSDFDNRNIFVGLVTYELPGSARFKNFTKGWEVNSLMTFHSGLPFSVYSSSDTSGTSDENQRANVVPGVDPYAGYRKGAVGANWLNPAAFVDAPAGTFGNSGRNAYTGPGFGDVDFSVFKNTPIGERVSTQFRVEMFNLFNRTNFASPSANESFNNPSYTYDNALALSTTIGSANGAPGIGAGEPFNTQFAFKIIF
ncbi:TonB-dependent receptor [Acidipila sp. EB88]|uniref:TonB-dependent receptor n=1 Tax=Acidipila sp. EB88 TaxID=2305226 RepID=UPI0013150DBC|nr:carboxypeptidase regulatory-like domain-containing protein [Acidipila sp. EB88]